MLVRPDLIAAKLGLDPDACSVEDVVAELHGEPSPDGDRFVARHFADTPWGLGAAMRLAARAPAPPSLNVRIVDALSLAEAVTQAESGTLGPGLVAYIVKRAKEIGLTARLHRGFAHGVQASASRDEQGRFVSADEDLTLQEFTRRATRPSLHF